MTAPSSCTPCGCLPGNISDAFFKSAALQAICDVIAAVEAGGGGGGGGNVSLTGINGVAPSVGNGVVGTGVLRVTLASDSTGQVAVASSALPTGAATQATLAALDAKVTAVNTGAVVISSGAITTLGTITPGVAATSLGKAEDAAHVSGDTGVAVWAIRSDTRVAFAGTDGDYSPFAVNDAGAVRITYDQTWQNNSTTSLLKLEDQASASGDSGVVTFGVRRDTASSLVSTEGDYIAQVHNQYGVQHVTIDRTFTFADNNHILKAEDVAATSGDAGVFALAVRRDTPATNVNAAGDYAELAVSGQGAAWVSPTPSVGGGWSKIKYAAQTTTVQTVKGTAGTLGGYFFYNPNATVAYVQIFDVATATTVTLGTTVPDLTLAIPPGASANLEMSNGVLFSLGIKLACTTTATGLTAPGTGLDLNVFYK